MILISYSSPFSPKKASSTSGGSSSSIVSLLVLSNLASSLYLAVIILETALGERVVEEVRRRRHFRK